MTVGCYRGYDRTQSYDWNYEHVPPPAQVDVPALPDQWQFCGLKVDSPLGIAAGPLLNGAWVLYYASLGFDVLTYKTVRSRERACYALPNLQPVTATSLKGDEGSVPASETMQGSWAVSFGMPSRSPDVWRADVEATRKRLPRGKLLVVSVVGTVQDGWSIEQLAQDYALCARWAVESGADCVEANFSCPNVTTEDGQLYQDPASARIVAQALREAVGRVPLLIKIGHIARAEAADALLAAVADHIDALVMVNTVAATISAADGRLLFAGQRRGIAGDAIRQASLAQVRLFAERIARLELATQIVGVGGISDAEHVRAHLAAGAQAVQLATAAMLDPTVGIKLRQDLASASPAYGSPSC